jgi:hypothetical protein
MRTLLIMILVEGLLAGCSSMSGAQYAAKNFSVTQKPLTGQETGSVPTLVTTLTATSPSKPLAITVKPPMIPISPVEGTPEFPTPSTNLPTHWQTFNSIELNISIEYPPTWVVTVQADEATFSSPQDVKVQLHTIPSGSGAADITKKGKQCTTLINSFGQSADACYDSVTNTYSAIFNLKSSDSATWQVVLSTTDQDALDVYQHMLDTLHLAQ